MSAPRDIDLGGVLVDSLCAIFVPRIGDPDRRSICCRSPRIEIDVRESSTGGGGPVRLHPRVSDSFFDLSDGGAF